MNLEKIQEKFKDYMFSHHGQAEGDLQDVFITDHRADAQERLDFYKTSVIGKLTSTLAISYPTIQQLVGEEFFAQLAQFYIKETPPKNGDVTFYGRAFPDFIKKHEDKHQLPYLYDVARLDKAYNDAYYARDDEALTLETLENKESLFLRDSVTLIETNYPIHKIREFCQGVEKESPDLSANETFYLMISRPELICSEIIQTKEEFTFLTYLKEKYPLMDALKKTLNAHINFDFQAFLSNYLPHKIFLS